MNASGPKNLGQSSHRSPLQCGDSMKTPPRTTARLRQIMALLTVVAAFMFQMRIDALGQLNPVQTSSHAGHQIPASSSTHIGHSGHHHHQAQSSSPAPTPRQPEPSNHHHSAHCPFCLTNAFGLEAGITELPQGPPDYLPAPELQPVSAYLAVFNIADARAPPVL